MSAATEAGRGWRDSARRIAVRAWPVFVGQVSVLAFGTIDTLFVARSSAGAVNRIRPIGIADLNVVEQTLCCYKAGEVAAKSGGENNGFLWAALSLAVSLPALFKFHIALAWVLGVTFPLLAT